LVVRAAPPPPRGVRLDRALALTLPPTAAAAAATTTITPAAAAAATAA